MPEKKQPGGGKRRPMTKEERDAQQERQNGGTTDGLLIPGPNGTWVPAPGRTRPRKSPTKRPGK